MFENYYLYMDNFKAIELFSDFYPEYLLLMRYYIFTIIDKVGRHMFYKNV